MKAARFMPHRVAPAGAFVLGPWLVRVDGSPPALFEGRVEGWDYATSLSFECQVQLDAEQFAQGTGLESLDGVELVAMAECTHSLYRKIVRYPLGVAVRDEFLSVQLEIDSERVARDLELSRHVVLGADLGSRDDDGRAHRGGARLFSDRRTKVYLEGHGGRFPTEAIPFSKIGREYAPWDVDCHAHNLKDSFLGSVRLLVNIEHPAGAAALAEGHPEHRIVVSVMRWDVVRRILSQVAASSLAEDVSNDDWEDGSLGSAVASICELYLKRSLVEVIAELERDPAAFDHMLQARLELLSGIR